MKTYIEWLGTIASILGAFLLPLGYPLIGYIAFSIGSVSWLGIGIYTKNKSLITLNATFFIANILGLVKNI